MNPKNISLSPLIIPSPNPQLIDSFYKKAPKCLPIKPKRIPKPIMLNKPNNKLPLNRTDELFDIDNEDIKDNSLNLSNSSMGSETKDDINDLSNEIENVDQYRHMLKRFKSGTVHEKSHDTETILTNERFAKDYSGLASKVLVPLKKNSCVDPMIVPLCEDIVKENKEFNYYEKRCPKMRRGYSILDILELTCNKK